MKKNILLLPNLFPTDEKSSKGIFIVDYIKVLDRYFNIITFNTQLLGNRKGYHQNILFNFKVYSFFLFSQKKIKKYLKPFNYLIWFCKSLLIAKSKFSNLDLIYSHDSVFHGLMTYCLSKFFKIPYIITVHTGPFSKISSHPIFSRISKFVIKNANHLLLVSKDLQNQIIASKFTLPKTTITYNPVNCEMFPLKNMDKKFNNILFVGRLEDYKGAFRVVKAFSKIRSYNNWTLTIIGDGPEKKDIAQYIKNNNLDGRILIKGHMTKKEIAVEMHKADFFVFPSKHETFGIVIAEAMACGLPVIVGNKTAPPEFVDDTNGILINPNDVKEIKNAIKRMIETFSEYDKFKIRDNIVKKFGFDSFEKKLKKIIDMEIKK